MIPGVDSRWGQCLWYNLLWRRGIDSTVEQICQLHNGVIAMEMIQHLDYYLPVVRL